MKVANKTSIQLRRENITRLLFFLGAVGLVFLVLIIVENLLLSTVLAFVFSYLLSPLVNRLERRGVNRTLSVTLIFALVTLTLAVVLAALSPFISDQITSFKSEISIYIEGIAHLIKNSEALFAKLSGTFFNIDISQKVELTLTSWTSSLFDDLPSILQKLFTTLLLAPFLTFFLLKDGRQFSKIILSLVPNNIFEMILNLYSQVNDQIGQFVRARLMESIFVGLLMWIGLFAIGARYATLLAVFAALTNLIPYVGPFIGAVPALVMALINGESSLFFFLTIMVYMITQLVDMLFIIPLVVAKIVDLHPVTVILAIIVGAQLMGVLGMIISIPVASALKVTVTSVYVHLVGFRN